MMEEDGTLTYKKELVKVSMENLQKEPRFRIELYPQGDAFIKVQI